jgi:hypothetical protein
MFNFFEVDKDGALNLQVGEGEEGERERGRWVTLN